MLRTFKFLRLLHINVIDGYDIDLTNNIYDNNPNVNSIIDNIDNLLVKYEDLLVFIKSFQQAFKELYANIEPMKHIYIDELGLIGQIYLYTKHFLDMNPKAIMTYIKKKISKDSYSILLDRFQKNNEDIIKEREDIKDILFLEEERKRIENDIPEQVMSSRSINKIIDYYKKDYNNPKGKFPISKKNQDNVVSLAIKGTKLGGLKKEDTTEQEKKKSNKNEPKGEKNVKIVIANPPVESTIPSQETKIDVTRLNTFRNSPNNPFSCNTVMHSLMPDILKVNTMLINDRKDIPLNQQQTKKNHYQPTFFDLAVQPLSEESPRAKLSNIKGDSINESKEFELMDDPNKFTKYISNKLSENLIKALSINGINSENPRKLTENQKLGVQAMINKKATINFVGLFDENPDKSAGQKSKKALGDPALDEIKETNNNKEKDKDKAKDQNPESDLTIERISKRRKTRRQTMTKKEKVLNKDFFKLNDELNTPEMMMYTPSKEEKGDDIPDEDLIDGQLGFSSGDDDNRTSEDGHETGSIMLNMLNPKKKRGYMLHPKSQAIQYYHYMIEKEPTNTNSKYFGPKSKYIYVGNDEDFNIGSWNRWIQIKEGFQNQVLEKSLNKAKAYEDWLNPNMMKTRRINFVRKLEAKQNQIPFNDLSVS